MLTTPMLVVGLLVVGTAGVGGWSLGARGRPAAVLGFGFLLLAAVALLASVAPGVVQTLTFGATFEGGIGAGVWLQRLTGLAALSAVSFALSSGARAAFASPVHLDDRSDRVDVAGADRRR